MSKRQRRRRAVDRTAFEKSQQAQHAYSLPKSCEEFDRHSLPSEYLNRKEVPLPEISELDLMRHFSRLAHKNMSIDTHFYPLGSCTMKLNPRVNEQCAALPGFSRGHPLAPEATVQGNLRVIHELIGMLCHICGMAGGSLLTNAGAQGEFIGIRLIGRYHSSRGDYKRDEILIPDNAHGTNPATAVMAGFKTVSIATNEKGDMDLEELRHAVSERTAGLMLTNPNTLGLFSPVIKEIAAIVHKAGGLLFYDGANLNPMLALARPGDMGFDVMHINLHKTFSTPHGGGGPGSGPVLCSAKLQPFLPVPKVVKKDGIYSLVWEDDDSVGAIVSFHGNFAIYLRAYLYIKLHGMFGLRRVAEQAVLNANYLKAKLGKYFNVPFSQACMHEFVVRADNYLDKGVRALDIAKRMLDYGVHAPTVYFPLIVKECMLIEPTETESLETLDTFIHIIDTIVREIQDDPALVKEAPHTMPVSRLDEVRAAKHPVLRHY